MTLAGRVALVTGGGSGVGLAIAEAIAGAGAAVALVARSVARLEQAAATLRAQGRQARAYAADVTQRASVETVVRQVRQDLGEPLILVHAAGTFGPVARVEETDPEAWQATLAIHCLAPYLAIRAVLPAMRAHRWGRILTIGSAASLHPPGMLTSAYAVSKAALDRLTRQVAAETHGTGITANVLHPGEIQSEMWATIRTAALAAGPEGDGLRAWADLVGSTGGDDPRGAGALALRLIADGAISGRFCWIDGGLQEPLPSWSDHPPAPRFRTTPTPTPATTAATPTTTVDGARAHAAGVTFQEPTP